MPFVVTVDQRNSRRTADRVPRALTILDDVPVVRAFERTAGDEFQGVLDDADAVVDTALRLVRDGPWSIGIGCGPVEGPLPATTRAGRGPAFEAAREAVEAAKARPQGIAVRLAAGRSATPDGAPWSAGSGTVGTEEARADAEAVLTLLAAVVARRTPAGWAALDALREAGTVTDAAARLGVTRQAVGQRLAVAQADVEQPGRHAAARLLLRCLDPAREDHAS